MSSFVDNHLLPGENVTYRTKLHWKGVAGPAIAGLLLLILGVLLGVLGNGMLPFGIGLGVVGLLIPIGPLLVRRSSEFAVTNKRVIIKLGLLNTRSIEILLSKIEAIVVNQGLAGKMLNFGDIVITGSGGTKEVFPDIERPLDFRRAVQSATTA